MTLLQRFRNLMSRRRQYPKGWPFPIHPAGSTIPGTIIFREVEGPPKDDA